MKLRGWGAGLALALAAVLLFLAPAIPAHAEPTDTHPQHLLLASSEQFDILQAALDASGARVLHSFPPNGLIAEISGGAAAHLVDQGLATLATDGPLSSEAIATLDPGVTTVVGVWNALLSPDTTAPITEPHTPLESAASFAPDLGGLSGQALDPSLYQQSDYLIGKVAVNVVLIESNGSVDASTEDWTPERQQLVIQEVVEAMNWWQAREPRAQVQFVYEDHYTRPVTVSYEPINRPHYEDRLWISEAMQQLGFGHSSYLTATRLFNRDTRLRRQTDWAFTIYVVDSLNDADNRFTDNYFAYGYIFGPYMVVTYGNNGYGPENMAAVVAHETGHIFGALDEYAESGITADRVSGYLGVATANAQLDGQTDLGSIMRGGLLPYELGQISPSAAGQVGWRDSDGDGILDPVDTEIRVALAITLDQDGVNLAGGAVDVAYPSITRTPLTINRLTAGMFRINEGPWRPLPCADGACDSADELFRLTLPPPPKGDWRVEVSFGNNRGNQGSYSGSFVMATGEPPVTPLAISAAVEKEEGGAIHLVGSVSAIDGSDSLAVLEHRLDSGSWRAVTTTVGSDESDGALAAFDIALASPPSGDHTVDLRAACADPWATVATWSQTFAVESPPQNPAGTLSTTRYLPIITSASE